MNNVAWLFFDKILRMGAGLFVGVWFARYLGPEQFGLWNYAAAFIGLFGVIAVLGLQNIVVRDIVRQPNEAGLVLGTAAVLQFFGGILSYSLIILSAKFLRPDDSLSFAIVAILGSVMLFKFSEIAAYWFESQVNSKYTVWVQNSIFIIFSVIKILLILDNATLVAFAWVTLVESIFSGLLLLLVMNLRGPSLESLSASFVRAKSLLNDSWPLILSAVSITIYMKIDQIMIGEMLGNRALGIYSAAVRISEIWYFIPMTIAATLFPAIIEAKKSNHALYQDRMQKLYDLMVFLSIAVAIPMTFFATPIVTLIFGSSYSEAGIILAIHIWASVFVFLGVASGQWFLAENRQVLALQRTALGAILNILINLYFIPNYGILGAAISLVITQAIVSWLYDCLHKETRKMFFMKLSALNLASLARRYL